MGNLHQKYLSYQKNLDNLCKLLYISIDQMKLYLKYQAKFLKFHLIDILEK